METRLGDIIDDYCVKCKRIMNHAVVSMLGRDPAKVRCRTCHGDHDYRHEQAPPPKIDPRKAALFHEVLSKMPEAIATPLPVPIEPEAEVEIEPAPAVAKPKAPVAAIAQTAKTKPAKTKKAKKG